jgi:ribosomal protein L11 methyltransferase
MPWHSVTLTVGTDSVEALSDALLEAGAAAVDLSDAHAGTVREQTLFGEPNAPGAPAWEAARIDVLFDEHADVVTLVGNALRAAGLEPVRDIAIRRVADQDWVRVTQGQFPPVHVSPRLWVVPTWHVPPDPLAINLVIDPGLAFGTGTHPTTRLCLAWLDANVSGGERVLDYGCGSGILAIAAIKLGAAYAAGVDIDAGALLAARQNAMQNRVAVQFESVDRPLSSTYDVVLANILANPLMLLAPLLAQATRGGGRIVLSGILEHQADEIGNRYHEWFDMKIAQHDDGWVLLSGVRR